MPRHKFVPLPQKENDVFGICEMCGALNNAGVVGCMLDEGKLNYFGF
jgi:hypothetical protein